MARDNTISTEYNKNKATDSTELTAGESVVPLFLAIKPQNAHLRLKTSKKADGSLTAYDYFRLTRKRYDVKALKEQSMHEQAAKRYEKGLEAIKAEEELAKTYSLLEICLNTTGKVKSQVRPKAPPENPPPGNQGDT